MEIEKILEREVYYSNDHDWIDFQGKVAYVGICQFKLTGFREIQQIILQPLGFKKKGEIISSIRYNDYLVDARMPVDGKVIQINDHLLAGNYSILAQQPEHNGWIALIIPDEPKERAHLLSLEEYNRKKYK